jgi:hypothetical protein
MKGIAGIHRRRNNDTTVKGMPGDNLSDQIAQLESEIDQLAETIERCRKAMLASRLAIGAGGIWILAYLVGAVGLIPAAMVGAIATVIGGLVVYGSNSSTSKGTVAAMKDAERLRTELIDRVDPRMVGRSY